MQSLCPGTRLGYCGRTWLRLLWKRNSPALLRYDPDDAPRSRSICHVSGRHRYKDRVWCCCKGSSLHSSFSLFSPLFYRIFSKKERKFPIFWRDSFFRDQASFPWILLIKNTGKYLNFFLFCYTIEKEKTENSIFKKLHRRKCWVWII